MKKFESIELVHLNGDSTVIVQEGILDLHIEEVTKDYDFIDGELVKSLSCKSFTLDILYNEKDDDAEVIKYLVKNETIIAAILKYEKDKVKEIDLPYLPMSDEDEANAFQITTDVALGELIEEIEEDGDKVLSIDISIYNMEFEEFEEE